MGRPGRLLQLIFGTATSALVCLAVVRAAVSRLAEGPFHPAIPGGAAQALAAAGLLVMFGVVGVTFGTELVRLLRARP